MNLDEIRSLAQIMKDAELTKIEVTDGTQKICLEKRVALTPALPPSSYAPGADEKPAAGLSKAAENLREIKSPMVGVFYASPSPEQEPYVKVGSAVKKGDVICVIEAMKLLNEISSDQDGEIAEVCADNGAIVEYGQVLFRLRQA